MPKQIDHDAHRRDIAQRAAPLFSEMGYSGLGMRRIAEELGLSKSALYHYFPTKKSLFLACTEAVMTDAQTEEVPEQTDDGAADALIAFARKLEPGFAREMALLFDYLRGKSANDIAADPAMRLANGRLRQQVEKMSGTADPDAVMCLMMGTLLMRHFTGGELSYETLRPLLDNMR